jgi:hypothetical protein
MINGERFILVVAIIVVLGVIMQFQTYDCRPRGSAPAYSERVYR